MRKFALIMAVLGTCFAALAVPAKPGKHTFTQSDGTSITVQTVGDEWHHSLVTDDGLTVIRTDGGDFVYRTASGASNVLAHNAGQRTADEQSFLAAHEGQFTLQALETQQQKSRRNSARKVSGPRKVGSTQVPTIGSPRVPIILIQYSDKSMKHTKANFETQYKTGAKSVYQYFADQSNGKYTPQYDVYGIYTLSSRATYGANDSSGNDVGVANMVGEAIDKAGNDIDWSQYDNDGDGQADVCIVVYAGVGEAQASYTVPNSIWPCQWSLSSGAYYSDGTGARTRNGVTIDRFAVFNEISGSSDNGSNMDGIGTFCHEFSHCLGLPDFYETTYNNGYYGMDNWSLMNSGCYNGLSIDGDTPIGYCAYEKNFMSWIDLIDPVPGKKYTLDVFNQKSEATDQAVKIVSSLNSNEYFILENRQQQGWDVCIEDEGVMINHVTYVASRWEDNTVNNQSIQLMTIIPADNSLSSSTNSGDLWPNGNKTEFTDNSTPAAKLNMTSSGSVSGNAGLLGKPVTEFTQNSDGTVSFWYMKGSVPALDAPVLADATNVGNTSFTASWTDNIDIDHTYTLLVNIKSAVQTLLSTTFGSGHGWTTSGSTTNSSSGYTQLGSRNNTGSVTSPDVTPESDKLSVSINAAYYSTDGSSMKVSLLNGSTTVDTYTQALTSDFADYDHVFNVTAGTAYNVKIETTASRKRVNLAKVVISSGDITAAGAPARAISDTGDADNGGRTITGITAKNYTVTGLTEGETYEFKVQAVPVDESEATESQWSNAKEVTLASDPVPTITATPTTIEMGELFVGQSATESFTVGAENLTGNVTIALTGSNAFSLDKNSLTAAQANGAEVNVTFAPTAVGEFTATATLSSEDAADVVVTLSGSAVLEKHDPVMLAADETKVGTTAFTADWTDATPDANVASYTLQVNEKAAAPKAILTETFDGSDVTSDGNTNVGSSMDDFADNQGWTGSYVYKAPSGVKFGSSRQAGTLTTPALNLSGSQGKVTVRFNAKYYNTDASSVKLTSGDNTTVTQALTNEATDYTVVLDCNDATAQTITFACTGGGKRFYIYNVEVFNGDVAQTLSELDGAGSPARASESGDATTRTITGITAKTYTVNDLNEGATYTYMVKAVYTDNTESSWSNAEEVTLNEVPTPVLTATPTGMTFEAIAGSSGSDSFEVLGTDLQGDVTLTLNDETGAFSLNTNTIAQADAEQGATVTVSFNPTSAGDYNATLTVASTNAESVTVTLTGTALATELAVNPTTLTIDQTLVGQSNSATFTVQGTNLINDVNLELSNAENSVFTLDSYVIEMNDAGQGATVTVTFTPTEAGEFTTTVGVHTDGAESQYVTVNAVAIAPSLSATPTSLDFEVVEGQSEAKTFTIEAANLQGPVTVTLADDNNVFSIDTETVVPDATNIPTVTVTFAPQTAGEYTATVTLSSDNVEDVVITLNGVANLDKEVPVMQDADQETLTDRSFVATWTAVPNVESYTLQVDKVALPAGAAARAPQETGDATTRTVTGITETSYTVANLDRATPYEYKVKAIYTDGTESDWSNVQTVTTKVKTGIDVIAASGRVTFNGRTLTGDEFTRVYNVAGQEIPAIDGTWTLDRGIYLIATPEGAAKIQVK